MQTNTSHKQAAPRYKLERKPGFARRRGRVLANGTWHETVTGFMPEPWLVALERDRIGFPFRPGHRPEASR